MIADTCLKYGEVRRFASYCISVKYDTARAGGKGT